MRPVVRAIPPNLAEILRRREVADALAALTGLLGSAIAIHLPLGGEVRFGSVQPMAPESTRQVDVHVGGQKVTLALRTASVSGREVDEMSRVITSLLGQAFAVDDLAAGALYANEQLEHVLAIVSKSAAWPEIDTVTSELLRHLHRQFQIDRAFAVVEPIGPDGPRAWLAEGSGSVRKQILPRERWERLQEEVIACTVHRGATKWDPRDVPFSVLQTLGIEARPRTPILTSPLGTSTRYLGLVGVRTLSAFSFGSIEAQWLEVVLTAVAGTMAALAFHQTEAALRDAEAAARHKAVTDASAMVAHKLGNPTAALLAHIRFLEEDLAVGKRTEDLASDLANMRTCAERIEEVTREFKDLVAKPRVRARRVDLAALVEKVVKAHVLLPYRLVFSPPSQSWRPFVLDPSLFRTVLEEIVGNAKQVMPNGGTIRVTLKGPYQADSGPDKSMKQRYVTVAVADEGPGIPASKRDDIFEPFKTSRAGGTGLGLAIVREYVGLMGASVPVESRRAAARGAIFRVAIPVNTT